MDIYTLCTNENGNEQSTEQVQNLQLYLNCVFSYGNGICSSKWPWPTASCSAFDQSGCAQLLQKVVQCLSIQFLLGYSLTNFRAENLLDSRKFDQNLLSSELNIFAYSILLHC